MLVYGELQTFTRILINNLIYDLVIMAIVYEIWNRVRPPTRTAKLYQVAKLPATCKPALFCRNDYVMNSSTKYSWFTGR